MNGLTWSKALAYGTYMLYYKEIGPDGDGEWYWNSTDEIKTWFEESIDYRYYEFLPIFTPEQMLGAVEIRIDADPFVTIESIMDGLPNVKEDDEFIMLRKNYNG